MIGISGFNQCSAKGAHSRERTRARPPLGCATALPPHGASSPRACSVRVQPARVHSAPAAQRAPNPERALTARVPRARNATPLSVHVSPPTVRLPTIHNTIKHRV
ncbi:hypothetical protein ACJJTC_017144 [Scirpophaga incertulas]